MMKLRPDQDQITAAAGVLAGYMKPSPVEREAEFCQQLDADVYVKYEFFNPVKTFRIRGALNIAHALQNAPEWGRTSTNRCF